MSETNFQKITICGLAGTGTTSLGKELAGKLGYAFISAGELFRKKAKEDGISLAELEERAKADERYDRDLDQRMQVFGRTHICFVVEGRLAWRNIPDSIKILLVCEDEIRIQRVARRDMIPFEQAQRETRHREALIQERYACLYGIVDLTERSQFDITISTEDAGVAEIASELVALLYDMGLPRPVRTGTF